MRTFAPPPFWPSGRHRPWALATLLVSGACLFWGHSAPALVRFDFEQMYYTHPQHQVWDFSLVRPDSLYHLYYHSIHEDTPTAAAADTIWHATSGDLRNWQLIGPVLTVGPDTWDAGAIWAPDVFPDSAGGGWMMAYTGCDAGINQRICFAHSDDLYSWTKRDSSSVLEPDPDEYIWNADLTWADFRDPFVYREDNQWHLLATAKKWITQGTGVIYHAVSDDLTTWNDVGILFQNDGEDPWRVLESPQLKTIGAKRHLVCGEFDTIGVSVISHADLDSLSMTNRYFIDYGYAPEIESFDPGVFLLSRLTPYESPLSEAIRYVVKIDTLTTETNGHLEVLRPHPLAHHWETWSGLANIASPTYGDNPVQRGEPSSGLVGYGYYSSLEYFQGPFGAGAAGATLGDSATGELDSYPFVIEGNRMDLLVGGGDYAQTCYVALVDVVADTVIYRETGNNQTLMTPRQWNLVPLQGRLARIRIVDRENGPFGYINVDEIVESMAYASPVSTLPATSLLIDHGPVPNPFNPRTTIRFFLTRTTLVELDIHDLRGRRIWSTGPENLAAGDQGLTWPGVDQAGHPLPAGTYLYRLQADGNAVAGGKLSLLK